MSFLKIKMVEGVNEYVGSYDFIYLFDLMPGWL